MDQKLQTFLMLCRTMNYRRTAELMHLTQPAVTRQIQSLEQSYGVKLFHYDSRTLEKTPAAALLESYAVSLQYNYAELEEALCGCEGASLRIGATKTIGDYVIPPMVEKYLSDGRNNLALTVDNTENLLFMLKENELDFAIVEGLFDKKRYAHRLFKMESFMGICPAGHPFAGRRVPLEELFCETLIVREKGSGTRYIFELELAGEGHTIDSFKKVVSISSFKLIKDLMLKNMGVTFAYHAIIENDERFDTFTLLETPSQHEFNFVYLKNTNAANRVAAFCEIQ